MIRTKKQTKCIICGNEGKSLYNNLEDRLFNAHGIWNIKKCMKKDCGIFWLDPSPLPEDIFKAYLNYYTHYDDNLNFNGFLRNIYNDLKLGYWIIKYHYKLKMNFWKKILGFILFSLTFKKSYLDSDIGYLSYKKNGKVLDVGCGNGSRLKLLKRLEWNVEGIDFDEKAVIKANEAQLNVKQGSIKEIGYPDCSFDAITVIQVVEHIHDPVDFIKECYRILKLNGNLVITTPNCQSFGSLLFKDHWRGIEPPRHLNIFSVNALKKILVKENFQVVKIKTRNSKEIIMASLGLKNKRKFSNGIFKASLYNKIIINILYLIENFLLLFFRNKGEQIVILSKK